MSNYEERTGPPPNWLAPTAGGVLLVFAGMLALLVAEAPGAGVLLALGGLLLGAYGLAKRDRVKRYGR